MNAILVFSLLVPQLTSTIPLTFNEIDCRNNTHLCRSSVQFYPCVRVGDNRTIVVSLEVENCPDGFVCDAEADTACRNIENHTKNKASNEGVPSTERHLSSFENYQEDIGESTELSLKFSKNDDSDNIQTSIKYEKVSTVEGDIADRYETIKQTTITTPAYYMFTHDTTVTDEIIYNKKAYDTSTVFDEVHSTQMGLNAEENLSISSTNNIAATITDLEEHTSKITHSWGYLTTEDSLGNYIESVTDDKKNVTQNNLAVNNDLLFEENDTDKGSNTLKVNVTTVSPDIFTNIFNQTTHDLHIVDSTVFDAANNNHIDYHNIVSKNVENNDTDNHIEERETRPLNPITPNINLLEQYTEINAESYASSTTQSDETDQISTSFVSPSFQDDQTITTNPEVSSQYLSSSNGNEYYIGDNTSSISLVENFSSTTVDNATTVSDIFENVSTTSSISKEDSSEDKTYSDIYGTTKGFHESERYSIKSTIMGELQELSTQSHDYFQQKAQNIESASSTIQSSTLLSNDDIYTHANEESTSNILQDFQLLSTPNQKHFSLNVQNLESTSSLNEQQEISTITNFILQHGDQTDETTESIKTIITEPVQSNTHTTIDIQSAFFSSKDDFSYIYADRESTSTILNDNESTINQDYSLIKEEDIESVSPNRIDMEASTVETFVSQTSDGIVNERAALVETEITESVENNIETTSDALSLFSSRVDSFPPTKVDGESTSTILNNSQLLSTITQDSSLTYEEDIESMSRNSIQMEASTYESFVPQSSDGYIDEQAAFMETEFTESIENNIDTTVVAFSLFSSRTDSFSPTKSNQESTSTIMSDFQLLSIANQDYSLISEEDVESTSPNSAQMEASTFEGFVSQGSDENVDERAAFTEAGIVNNIDTTADTLSPFSNRADTFSSTKADEKSTSIILNDSQLLFTINQDYSITNEGNIESTSSNSIQMEASTFESFVSENSDGNVDERAAFMETEFTESIVNNIDTTADAFSPFSGNTDSFSSTKANEESASTIPNDSQLLFTVNQDYSITNEGNIESTSSNSIQMEASTFESYVSENSDGNVDERAAFMETEFTESIVNNIDTTADAFSPFSGNTDSFSSTKANEESASTIPNDSQLLSTMGQNYSLTNEEDLESTSPNSIQLEVSTFTGFVSQSSDENVDERTVFIETGIVNNIDTTADTLSPFSNRADTFSSTKADEKSTSIILNDSQLLSTINQDYSLINEENIESTSPNSIQMEASTFESFVSESSDGNVDERAAFIETDVTELAENNIGTTADVSPFSNLIDSSSPTKADENSTSTILNDSQLLLTMNENYYIISNIGTTADALSPFSSRTDSFSPTNSNQESTSTILNDFQLLSTPNQDYSLINEEEVESTSPNSIQIEVSTFESFVSQSSDENVDERAAFIETEIVNNIGTTADVLSPFSSPTDSISPANVDEQLTSTILNDFQLLSTTNEDYSFINEENTKSMSPNSIQMEASTFESFVPQSSDGNVDEKTAFIETEIIESTENNIGTPTDAVSSFTSSTDSFSPTKADEESISIILNDSHPLSTINEDYSLINEEYIESTSSSSIQMEASTFESYVSQNSDGNVDERAAFIETDVTELAENNIGTAADAQLPFFSSIDSFLPTKVDEESISTISSDYQLLSTINQGYSLINEENIESTNPNSIQMEASTFESFTSENSVENDDERAPFIETDLTELAEDIIGTTVDEFSPFSSRIGSFSPTKSNQESTSTIMNDFQLLSTLNQDYSLINEEEVESTSPNSIQVEVSTFDRFVSQSSDENVNEITAFIETGIVSNMDTTVDVLSPSSSRTDSFSPIKVDEELTSTILNDFQLLSTTIEDYSLINEEDIESTSLNSIQLEVSTFEGFVSQSSDGNVEERAVSIETGITSNIDTLADAFLPFFTRTDSFSSTKADEKSTTSTTLTDFRLLSTINQDKSFPYADADEEPITLNNPQLLSTHTQVNILEEDMYALTTDTDDVLQYSLNDVGTSRIVTFPNSASNADATIKMSLENDYTTESSSPLVSLQWTLQTRKDVGLTIDSGLPTTSGNVGTDEGELISSANADKVVATEDIIRDDKRELVSATEININEISDENQNVFTEAIMKETEVTNTPSSLDDYGTSVTNVEIAIELSTASTVILDQEPQLPYTDIGFSPMHANHDESTSVKLEPLKQNETGSFFESTEANTAIDFGVKDMSTASIKIEVNNSKLEDVESSVVANLSKLDVMPSKKSEIREATPLPSNVDTTKKFKPERQPATNAPFKNQTNSSVLSTTPASIPSKFKCTSSGKFPEPNDCSVYHYCVDILVEYVHFLMHCPPGTLYDPTIKDCTDKPVRCSQDIIAPICTASGIFPHPTDCNLYYKCFWRSARRKFTLWQFKCPAHMKYDPQRKVCVNGALLPNCDSSSGPVLEVPFYCSENGRFPVEYSCDSYYDCKWKKTEFQRKVKFCSPGKLFDRETGTCRKSALVFCPYKNDNFVADSFEEVSEGN